MNAKEIIEILKAFEMVNPRLISDGGGEFSNVYAMQHDDAIKLAAILEAKSKEEAEKRWKQAMDYYHDNFHHMDIDDLDRKVRRIAAFGKEGEG